MRTRSHFAALLVMALAVGAGPAVAQDVTIVPKLRAGEGFQLEVIRTRENSSRSQQNSKTRTLVDVRAVSAGPEGFVIEWVPGDTMLDSSQAAPDPIVGVASQALRGIKFRLNLNVDGELTGVANQAEVAPKLKAVVDAIIRELSARVPDAQRKQFLDFMGQVLSADVLIASATRDAGTYFGLNGVSLASSEAVEIDIEQPNPLGGAALPARFSVRMESVTAETASLKTLTSYDAASLVRMTESLAKQAGAPIAPDELAKLPPIEMADEGTYLFDRHMGLMREVVVSRRVTVGPNRRLDAWQIRLLSGPR